jgi:hypothetical protein
MGADEGKAILIRVDPRKSAATLLSSPCSL